MLNTNTELLNTIDPILTPRSKVLVLGSSAQHDKTERHLRNNGIYTAVHFDPTRPPRSCELIARYYGVNITSNISQHGVTFDAVVASGLLDDPINFMMVHEALKGATHRMAADGIFLLAAAKVSSTGRAILNTFFDDVEYESGTYTCRCPSARILAAA